MKKYSFILLIISCSIIISAQTVTENNVNWQTLAPTGEEYSIDFPTTKDEYGNINLSGTYFFIEDGNNVLKELKTLKKTGKTVTVGKYKGNKFVFEDADSLYQTILIIKTKNNNYAFRTYSQTMVNPNVERFFNSLIILDKPMVKKPIAQNKKVNKPVQKQTKKQNPTDTSNDKDNLLIGNGNGNGRGFGNGSTVGEGRGSGRGDGGGIGNGNGEGDSNDNKEQTTEKPILPAKITKSITFLSLPKPGYTDLARQRGIQGKVVLRITFLANGQIGSITPVVKLPFGLTVSAITTAKKIIFQPAMKDGQAYSVTKYVEFNFTIY